MVTRYYLLFMKFSLFIRRLVDFYRSFVLSRKFNLVICNCGKNRETIREPVPHLSFLQISNYISLVVS